MACHGDIYNDEQLGFIDLSGGEAPLGYSEVGLSRPLQHNHRLAHR
jgi:hypothetical protein